MNLRIGDGHVSDISHPCLRSAHCGARAGDAALPSDCTQSDYPARVIPACTEILNQDPNNSIAYFKRGKAYLDQRTDTRDLPLATVDLTKAIEIDPKYADAYNQRGIAFRRNGDFARAIADQSKAIEIKPTFARAYNSRGFAYQQQKDYDRALADYSKAIELDPGYAIAHFNRAITHDQKGRYESRDRRSQAGDQARRRLTSTTSLMR